MLNIGYDRTRWALLAIVVVASGVFVLRRPKPEYEAAAIVASESAGQRENVNPVRGSVALNPVAAVDLMKRARIADTVVKQLGLYVTGETSADARLVEKLTLKDRFLPGEYTLTLDDHSQRWLLAVASSTWVDSGIVGDSLGRNFGLNWQPEPAALARFAGHDVTFDLTTPRKAALDLMARLTVVLTPSPGLLRLTLADPDPRRAAKAVNAISRAFVTAAGALNGERVIVRDSATTPGVPFKNTLVQRLGVALASGVAIGVVVALVFAAFGAGQRIVVPV